MPDVRKLPYLACALLVLLRFCIGWQFFYEGMWKLNTQTGPEPWTSAGYLKASKGPFRSFFRGMVDDPDDLDKLDAAKVAAGWDAWVARFKAQHPDLNELQIQRLDQKLVELKEGKPGKEPKDLKKGLKQWLVDNPDWVGVVREKYRGTIDEKSLGEIELYKQMLARYEANLRGVKLQFQQDHLDAQWADIQAKRKMLVEPIDALTAELEATGKQVLTLEQLSRGPVPPAPSKVHTTDQRTIWLLLVVGALMMLGLFSRSSSAAAAVFLTMVYLTIPPWPGVPEAPGPEHALIVNKNFIELIACLALASMPTGRWAGLDALIARFVWRQKTD